MNSNHPSLAPPACPLCGSRVKVVRMASSLTPFERPSMESGFEPGRFYCTECTHDFVPEPAEEDELPT